MSDITRNELEAELFRCVMPSHEKCLHALRVVWPHIEKARAERDLARTVTERATPERDALQAQVNAAMELWRTEHRRGLPPDDPCKCTACGMAAALGVTDNKETTSLPVCCEAADRNTEHCPNHRRMSLFADWDCDEDAIYDIGGAS